MVKSWKKKDKMPDEESRGGPQSHLQKGKAPKEEAQNPQMGKGKKPLSAFGTNLDCQKGYK